MSERSVKSPVRSAHIRDAALVKQRRGEIVRGALKVFHEKGFHVATVRDIGEAAGLTQGTLYNYVRSKDEVLFFVCDELVQSYQDAVRAAIEAHRDPETRLAAAIRAVAAVMHAHQDDILLMYQETHALPRDARRAVLHRVGEFIDYFRAILEESREKGLITYKDVRMAANIVTFLPAIVSLRRWYITRDADGGDVIDGIVEFIMAGLGASPPRAGGSV